MSQISAFDPVDSALRSPSNGFNGLRSEDFIRIIFTELANQDPFQPNDSAALLEQLDSIRSIESDVSLMERLDALVFENKLASAANLIGKTVQGLTVAAQRVAGTVISVLRQGDGVMLELDTGHRIPVSGVEIIHDPIADPGPGPQP